MPLYLNIGVGGWWGGGEVTVDNWLTNTEDNIGGLTMFQAGKQNYTMIKDVRQNFERMTKREAKEPLVARTVQSRIKNTISAKCKQTVSVNDLKNLLIHPEDISNTTPNFGPNVAGRQLSCHAKNQNKISLA